MKTVNERVAFVISHISGAMAKLSAPTMDSRAYVEAMRELKTCGRELIKIQSALIDKDDGQQVYVNEENFTPSQLDRMPTRAGWKGHNT